MLHCFFDSVASPFYVYLLYAVWCFERLLFCYLCLHRGLEQRICSTDLSLYIDDGEDSVGGLELPESNFNGDITLAFSLELVENPDVQETLCISFAS